MAQEIERKYLVNQEEIQALLSQAQGQAIQQGYIPTQNNTTVRVRIKGTTAFLTLKGKTQGIRRSEFEYPIPLDDAQAMLRQFCGEQRIVKTRYALKYHGKLWEVDVFEGRNAGLILAEVELQSERELVDLPSWVTREVSHDAKYYNVKLMKHPYSEWPEKHEPAAK